MTTTHDINELLNRVRSTEQWLAHYNSLLADNPGCRETREGVEALREQLHHDVALLEEAQAFQEAAA